MKKLSIMLFIFVLMLNGCSNNTYGVEKDLYKKGKEYIQIMYNARHGDKSQEINQELTTFISKNTSKELDEKSHEFLVIMLLMQASIDKRSGSKPEDLEKFDEYANTLETKYGIEPE